MIAEGKKAPAFRLKDATGERVVLNEIDSDFTVIFFYPKDNTPGCTIEAKGFEKLKKAFQKEGATVVGISGGDEESKAKFCKKNRLSIPLVSDTDFKVSKKYGVYGTKKFMGRSFQGIHRTTFILNDRKKVIKIFPKVNPLNHPKEVLQFLRSIEEA